MRIRNPVLHFSVKSILLLFAVSLLATSVGAQNSTRGEDKKPDESLKSGSAKKKVLLIPFDPKMYMSDIDRSINRETKMDFKEIRDAFRSGIDNQLNSRFRTNYTVISLLRDTVKTKKDLLFIYKSTGYKYTVTQGKEKETGQKNISKGQLTVPVRGDEERYMRTVINQPGLLEAMNKKYGAELFVFISEIDLKNTVPAEGGNEREAAVHFTVYDLAGKQVGGGLAKVKFDADLNEPKRIISRAFPAAAQTIYTRSTLPPAQADSTKRVPERKK
ncbi:MAG TPA: hypothetical protein VGO45_05505 [Bacteroidia bacterium]|jgi:hypothetical protein|nr:hypothetical protein [Bacteroidia bacterium]